MRQTKVHSALELMEYIQQIGFLPLLDSGICGFCADDIVSDECRYVMNPDGGWDWPLWKWKGPVVNDGNCVYGKFFAGKAGFISMDWWPHFCNYRRSKHPVPQEGSIEEMILSTLREHDHLITRELRAACGFDGKNMRSRFDGYVTRLQMGCYIVTEDFVYPRDRHNREYGWGWSLLTTPEKLYGYDKSNITCSPKESYEMMIKHLSSVLPTASEQQIAQLIK